MSLSKRTPSPNPDKRLCILLLGNYRPALAAARVLSAAGYHVIMGKRGGEGFNEYSRFVDEAWDHPAVEKDPDGFELALTALLSNRRDIKLVMPISEAFVMFFAEAARALPDGVTLVSPRKDLIKTCADKTVMLSLAVDTQVPVLPYAVLTADSDIVRSGHEVGLPMVARPLSPGAKFDEKKAVILEGWEAYNEFVSRFLKPDYPILIQRRALGSRENLFFTARNGTLVNTLQTHINRTDSADGTGYAVDGVTVPVSAGLLQDCEKLVQALDYTGIGLAQFIVDPRTGDRCFLELNPRIAGSQAITEQLGFDMSHIAVQLAMGGDPTPPEQMRRIRTGIRYAWTYGDLRGLCSSLWCREIGLGAAALWAARMVWTALRTRHHMTWSWHDPVPAIMLFARQLIPSMERLSGTSVERQMGAPSQIEVGETQPTQRST